MAADILGPEWHLTQAGVDLLTENGSIKDKSQILKRALDTDMKEIGASVISKELNKEKTSKIVLQIQKIRNISAPKVNEESQAAPRMLKFILTDGETSVQAIEMSTIQQISREKTAPGTKIVVNGAKISSGFLLFNSSCVTVLGGKVPHLVERWELAKSVQKSNRQQGNTDGPPPWVNFGCKIQGEKSEAFKSLEPKIKDPNKDDTEFEQQRQKALAEASSGAVKKVFGGRVKEQVQPVVNRNLNSNNNRRNERRGFKSRNEPREVDDVPQKPLEKVSLFDFLETKLPVTETAPRMPEKQVQQYNKTSNYQQNRYEHQQNKYEPQQSRYERKTDFKNTPRPSNSNNYNNGYNNYPKSNEPYNNKKDNYHQNGYNNFPKPNEPYPKKDFGNKDFQKSTESYNKKDTGYNKKEHKPQNSYQNPRPQLEQKPEKNANDLAGNMSRLSLGNSNFASKTLRQQLNISTTNKRHEENQVVGQEPQGDLLEVGNECLAKYWEDGKFYNATITAITPKTYVVKFKGYDNIEEILKTDCQAISNNKNNRSTKNEKYSGSMEFHRGRKVYSKN